ncbi:MAG: hypothetical protein HQM08_17285 [Candidatus Riflebacteria bacterium]|nr:hypothetical protein [Candidatus Riflebacteria bacterium]
MLDLRKMSPEEIKAAVIANVSPAMREKILEIWKKHQEFLNELLQNGMIICPMCKSFPIEKSRKCCAVCESKTSHRVYYPGGNSGGKK